MFFHGRVLILWAVFGIFRDRRRWRGCEVGDGQISNKNKTRVRGDPMWKTYIDTEEAFCLRAGGFFSGLGFILGLFSAYLGGPPALAKVGGVGDGRYPNNRHKPDAVKENQI